MPNMYLSGGVGGPQCGGCAARGFSFEQTYLSLTAATAPTGAHQHKQKEIERRQDEVLPTSSAGREEGGSHVGQLTAYCFLIKKNNLSSTITKV